MSILCLTWIGELRGFVVEGHSYIGLLTFDVKVQLIDQIDSMVYVDFKVMEFMVEGHLSQV